MSTKTFLILLAIVTVIAAIWLGPFALLIPIIAAIIKWWPEIKQAFTDAWEFLKEAWDGIKIYWNEFTDMLADYMVKFWVSIKDFFNNIWNSIMNIIEKIKNSIANAITAVFDFIKNVLKKIPFLKKLVDSPDAELTEAEKKELEKKSKESHWYKPWTWGKDKEEHASVSRTTEVNTVNNNENGSTTTIEKELYEKEETEENPKISSGAEDSAEELAEKITNLTETTEQQNKLIEKQNAVNSEVNKSKIESKTLENTKTQVKEANDKILIPKISQNSKADEKKLNNIPKVENQLMNGMPNIGEMPALPTGENSIFGKSTKQDTPLLDISGISAEQHTPTLNPSEKHVKNTNYLDASQASIVNANTYIQNQRDTDALQQTAKDGSLDKVKDSLDDLPLKIALNMAKIWQNGIKVTIDGEEGTMTLGETDPGKVV